jgi:hypothetical protein
MSEIASPNFILSIPGTQDTQELPRGLVLEAIRRGEIGHDHWVWSPSHNDWKQVSEIPELQVSPSFTAESNLAGTVADLAADEVLMERREVEIPDAGFPERTVRTKSSSSFKIKDGSSGFKFFFWLPFLAVSGVIAANYFMIDKPFANKLAMTPFKSVQVYAHLGAFVQENALLIHILPAKELTKDDFADLLAAIAKSTPSQPFNHKPFNSVGLTSSWQSQYIFIGADWQKLGQMEGASHDDKKKFELAHFEYTDGSPLAYSRKTDNPIDVARRQNKAWQALVAHFLPTSP